VIGRALTEHYGLRGEQHRDTLVAHDGTGQLLRATFDRQNRLTELEATLKPDPG
jgi:hypothetical protein